MSFPRKRESITNCNYWTPAFAGVTDCELLEIPLSIRGRFMNSLRDRFKIKQEQIKALVEQSEKFKEREIAIYKKRKSGKKVKSRTSFSDLISESFKGSKDIFNATTKGNNFICKHCLKTIIVERLEFSCPHCEEYYGALESTDILSDVLENIKQKSILNGISNFINNSGNYEKKLNALFDKCPICDGVIRYINCPYCPKEIDMLEPYDEEELQERRIYGRR